MKLQITYKMNKDTMSDAQYYEQDEKVLFIEEAEIRQLVASKIHEFVQDICEESFEVKIVQDINTGINKCVECKDKKVYKEGNDIIICKCFL